MLPAPRSTLASSASLLLLVGCCLISGCNEAQPVPTFSGNILINSRITRIVVYGDTQSRHPLEFWKKDTTPARRRVAYRVAQLRPDLVINAGDLVDRGGSASAWTTFDEENAWLRRQGVPYYPVLGNHDFMGGTIAEALDNFFSRFPYLNRRRYYDLRVGPVAFIMLDSNFDKLANVEIRGQLRWLQQTLDQCERDPSVRLVVIVAHHPPFTNSSSIPPSIRVTHFILPLLSGTAKCRLFFSGHVHSYERFRVGGVNYIVTGGGGAPLDTVEESVFPKDLYPGGPVRPFHYCLLTIYPDRCSVEMFQLQPDGTWLARDSLEVQW